jgi:hypothetical protein
VVPEKFDIVTLNHKVNVEYGNVGVDFKFIPREGFGWMNSSFEVGLSYCTTYMRRALGALVHPDRFFDKGKHKLESGRNSGSAPATFHLQPVAADVQGNFQTSGHDEPKVNGESPLSETTNTYAPLASLVPLEPPPALSRP